MANNANVPRVSERATKGIPPKRFGFEEYGPEDCAIGGMNWTPKNGVSDPASQYRSDGASGFIDLASTEKTLMSTKGVSKLKPNYATSIRSKSSKKISVREVEHLKKILKREAEIHEIEMLKLEKQKAFLLRKQQLENELKQREDAVSNNYEFKHKKNPSEGNMIKESRKSERPDS